MSNTEKSRGRGLSLLQALKKSQSPSIESSIEPIPSSSAAPSIVPSSAPSVTSSSANITRGRGRIASFLQLKQLEKLEDVHVFPASDVSPSLPPSAPRGAGRGLKLLESLKKLKMAESTEQEDVQQGTRKIVASTVSTVQSTLVPKNKDFREVKETPPVIMKGDSGTPCEVTANYIYLNVEENSVYEYEVLYEPEQDYKNLRFKLLNEHYQYFKEKTFDGTTLYVPRMLPEEALNLVSTNPFDNSKVNIKILFRRVRRLSEMVHIYNVLFKHIMKDLQLVRFGRQHFNEHSAILIPQHNLEVWPGYVTAVDEYEGGLMLTLDSAHRVLRTQSVLSVIKEAVHAEKSKWKHVINEKLIGYSVMTTYNKKLFRVDSIDDTMTPKSTFEKNEGGRIVKISYIDYYKNNYGISIMDWDQPMLISRDTKRMPGSDKPTDFMICLVPELCQMTGLSENQRSNFRLMKDVATYTRITPNQRHSAFKKFIQNVLNNEKAKSRLAGWGLSIAQETIDITARTLMPEALYFGNNVKIPGKSNADWNGEVTRNEVMQAVDILKWIILYTDRDKKETMDFLDTLKRCSRPMGINVSNPNLVLLSNDRTESYVIALKKNFSPQLQLVVAICPTQRDDRYSAIKSICCVQNPVPSQVINSRTIKNPHKIRSVTQKILLQMNCKLGGTLWNISMPFKTAMIIGIDSYHDATRKKRSVCSFIASYNQSMTQWYSKAVFQECGQEIVDSLKSCLIESLKHYLRTNGRLPDRIIIYRDGVGDGQLQVIQNYEIPQLQVCFPRLDATYKPSLTYVVVQKRINTKIFLKANGGFDNPPPGTVVDHAITRRDWYDFLITSQKVNQGTVMPTHYIVVHDSSGMTADQCQRLTYKMCHLYYNWPGTVRVPAPCQYAHKLAYLVGQNIHQHPSDTLSDKLFFL